MLLSAGHGCRLRSEGPRGGGGGGGGDHGKMRWCKCRRRLKALSGRCAGDFTWWFGRRGLSVSQVQLQQAPGGKGQGRGARGRGAGYPYTCTLFPVTSERLIAEVTNLYLWGTKTAQRRFCSRCGILPFYVPRSNPDGIGITLHCVDWGAAAVASTGSRVTAQPALLQNRRNPARNVQVIARRCILAQAYCDCSSSLDS